MGLRPRIAHRPTGPRPRRSRRPRLGGGRHESGLEHHPPDGVTALLALLARFARGVARAASGWPQAVLSPLRPGFSLSATRSATVTNPCRRWELVQDAGAVFVVCGQAIGGDCGAAGREGPRGGRSTSLAGRPTRSRGSGAWLRRCSPRTTVSAWHPLHRSSLAPTSVSLSPPPRAPDGRRRWYS